MEKQPEDAPNNRPASRSGTVISKEPETPQSDVRDGDHSLNTSEAQYVTGLKLAVILSAVTLTAFLIMLDVSIIATATPKITSEFHSLSDVGWYGSAYLLTSSALQPMSGKLYARFNVKYTYVAFFALFELGSLICGVSTSSSMFIVGRAIAGMGSSGVGNGALTILSASIPLVNRALYFSIGASFGQLGVVLAPLIGGALTEYTTWRWCFYINLPVGVIAVAALLFIPIPTINVKGPEKMNFASLFHDLDLAGFLLFSPTMIMFLLALEWGGVTYPWDNAAIIGLFCGAAGNLALFLIWEYKKGDSAMIPFEMVKRRVVYSATLNMFFLFANSSITSYYLAIYFQGVRGKTPTVSGVYMLPGIVSQMISGVVSGFAVTRLGYYLPWAVTGTVLTAVGSGLISTFTLHTNTGTWVGYQIVSGLGRGLALQMPLVAIQNNLPASQIAVSVSFLQFSQNFGGSVWLSIAETAFDNGLANALSRYAPGISAKEVESAGVLGIRSIIPQASLEGVILAYNTAIQHVFYVVAGTAVAAFMLSWGLGWKSVKKMDSVASEV